MHSEDILKKSPLEPHTAFSGKLVQIKPMSQRRFIPSRFNARAVDATGTLIIWNTYSAAISAFKPEHREKVERLLRKDGIEGELKGLARYLYQRGYLVEQGTNEYLRVQYKFGQQQYRSDALELILLASEDCNFRCVYCYEDFARGTMLPAVRASVRKLAEKRAPGLKSFAISWFGGEPLYGWEAVEELAPFFKSLAEKHSLRYHSHMTTNGYLLTPEVAAKLLHWDIRDFQITLDGPSQTHNHKRPTRDGKGTFDTILSNLRSLRDTSEKFAINIRVNFDQENLGELGPFLDDLKTDFAGDPRFSVAFHAVGRWGGSNDENLPVCGKNEAVDGEYALRKSAYTKGLKIGTLSDTAGPGDHVCYAARPYNFIVGADGKIMKCTVALDKDEGNIIGHITDEGELVLDHDRMALWVEPAFQNDPVCQGCYLVPTCQGMHCPLIRMEEHRQPCPSVKSHIRTELLTMLQTSMPKATARVTNNSITVE